MKITANMLTIARIVLMPIPGWMLYQGADLLFVGLGLITILGITDYLDGIMARREGPTVLGGLLDPIADKIFIAVIYLPLTEMHIDEWDRTVIPLWMTIAVFIRDFLVTTLRSTLSLRDAPMRTSTLAKFKTAIQMAGGGYIIFMIAALQMGLPDWATLVAFTAPVLVPLSLMLWRLFTGRKQGKRSVIMLALMSGAVVLRWFAGPDYTCQVLLAGITALTVISGFSYLSDAWSALKGSAGFGKEIGRFILDGVLVPLAFLLILGRLDAVWISAVIVTAFSLELAVGGLGNLLASQKIALPLRWVVVKSVLQVVALTGAFAVWYLDLLPGFPAGEVLTCLAAGATLLYSTVVFVVHRSAYLSKI